MHNCRPREKVCSVLHNCAAFLLNFFILPHEKILKSHSPLLNEFLFKLNNFIASLHTYFTSMNGANFIIEKRKEEKSVGKKMFTAKIVRRRKEMKDEIKLENILINVQREVL